MSDFKAYPVRFEPIFKERLWGGKKLNTVLNKDVEGEHIGESWELSGVPGDVSAIVNGDYKNQSLNELIEAHPKEVLGGSVYERFGKEFPILIKFIDARLDLSIQLHPNDELARERHNSFGKTEMWYVMQAEEDAELIVGFKEPVSKAVYEEALAEGKLTDLLHYQPVKPGDGFFIQSGRVHAIGAGILLAEIQQTSDVTYRVYDFDRVDAQGNKRELHTELALDAMDFGADRDFEMDYARTPNQSNNMIACPYFTTNYLKAEGEVNLDVAQRGSFTVLMGISGSSEITVDGHSETLLAGQTLLVPAAAERISVQSSGAELLEVSV
ncbi:mannose-6-phosphate isomerase, type 1 [Robiginitalea myxolifaciens]|uniref:Mannose-6-phosphate isomerase, type 1 n=1 Tax=Robiginitalea myxolifaciens TaxID=400055 RepID=A0A1I6FNU0_9FLAO|nr:type I phosphomannose isomerase catalytic subunit [Robiginitalea myxolifaciens]SFR31609.1 mannose-6-phosphate isomerase, type 1 [Robiginitalea myxolifaciens]